MIELYNYIINTQQPINHYRTIFQMEYINIILYVYLYVYIELCQFSKLRAFQLKCETYASASLKFTTTIYICCYYFDARSGSAKKRVYWLFSF